MDLSLWQFCGSQETRSSLWKTTANALPQSSSPCSRPSHTPTHTHINATLSSGHPSLSSADACCCVHSGGGSEDVTYQCTLPCFNTEQMNGLHAICLKEEDSTAGEGVWGRRGRGAVCEPVVAGGAPWAPQPEPHHTWRSSFMWQGAAATQPHAETWPSVTFKWLNVHTATVHGAKDTTAAATSARLWMMEGITCWGRSAPSEPYRQTQNTTMVVFSWSFSTNQNAAICFNSFFWNAEWNLSSSPKRSLYSVGTDLSVVWRHRQNTIRKKRYFLFCNETIIIHRLFCKLKGTPKKVLVRLFKWIIHNCFVCQPILFCTRYISPINYQAKIKVRNPLFSQ